MKHKTIDGIKIINLQKLELVKHTRGRVLHIFILTFVQVWLSAFSRHHLSPPHPPIAYFFRKKEPSLETNFRQKF